jgi:hypothetical protein
MAVVIRRAQAPNFSEPVSVFEFSVISDKLPAIVLKLIGKFKAV